METVNRFGYGTPEGAERMARVLIAACVASGNLKWVKVYATREKNLVGKWTYWVTARAFDRRAFESMWRKAGGYDKGGMTEEERAAALASLS